VTLDQSVRSEARVKMSGLRRVGGVATDVACLTLGRRQVVRAARFALRRATLDVPNNMNTNGEKLLQRWIFDLLPNGRKVHVLDVGANVGEWSASMLAAAQRVGRLDDLDLHAFEPASDTFACLSERLNDMGASLNHVAVSDTTGSSLLHIMGPTAGTNSLHAAPVMCEAVSTESVSTVTLADYVARSGLPNIGLLKIDTEGHDLAVLRSGRILFADHRVSVTQFEYNWRWIKARSFLSDAFDLLCDAGYRIGKLTPRGVEFYPGWDPDLETFVEGNYVAATPECATKIPAVSWWKRPV
jgi:FkbM family methyltransferase